MNYTYEFPEVDWSFKLVTNANANANADVECVIGL